MQHPPHDPAPPRLLSDSYSSATPPRAGTAPIRSGYADEHRIKPTDFSHPTPLLTDPETEKWKTTR